MNGRSDAKPRPRATPAGEVAIASEREVERLIAARERYDRIELNRLLERVNDPASLLRRTRALLTPGGEITATVANAQNHRILRGLFHGSWQGAADPVLPEERLRFFTRRELEKLFYRTGFVVRRIEPLEEMIGKGAAVVQLGDLELDLSTLANAGEFLSEAYRITAIYERQADFGLTSIVILTHNQWEYTRRCLESIRFRTDEPYELIIVDNGSRDGTPQRLSAMPDVRLIANGENRGFPAGVNQGIRAAQGRQILLLNNDVVVTTGWLRRQLAALYKEPTIGLVGPCSNEVSGPQWIAVGYDDLSALDGFAWEWGQKHAGQVETADRLVGFCLLLRKELIDEIGLFDERFGLGNFEDDDYCMRAIRAGYRAVIARDAFVHHFGHRTFQAAGIDLRSLLAENERRFRKKWDEESSPRPQALSPKSLTGEQSVSASSVPTHPLQRPLLSLCMIVRDNERTIRPCLESIKPWVDEMIVVDTGSTDATPAIAAELGAQVYHFPWCDSFSAARNESLKYARGEWIFWMDSDDTIPPDNGRKLRDLAAGAHPDERLGYIMQVHCPTPRADGPPDVTVVDHVKLFRNRRGLNFENRIHEQVLPSIRRAGGTVAFTPLFVVHSGADQAPEGRRRKVERDLKLLELELVEQPDHPFTLFNLGMTYADEGRHADAVRALRRSLAVAHPEESHVRKVYALLVSSHWQLGEYDLAWQTCQEGRRLFPKDPELLFREGMLAQHFGRCQDAAAAYEGALANNDDAHFSSIDRGIVGYKARHNLAIVYGEMGDLERAIAQWRLILQELPDYRDAWEGLVDALIKRGDLAEAAAKAEKLSGHALLRSVGLLAAARVSRAKGDADTARRLIETARSEAPADVEVQRAWCEVLFHHASLEEAEAALEELVRLFPGDASAHHNLALVRSRLGQVEKARCSWEESQRLRSRPATAVCESVQPLGREDAAKELACAQDYPLNLPHAEALSPALCRNQK